MFENGVNKTRCSESLSQSTDLGHHVSHLSDNPCVYGSFRDKHRNVHDVEKHERDWRSDAVSDVRARRALEVQTDLSHELD